MEIVLEHKMDIEGFKVFSRTGSKYSVLVLEGEDVGEKITIEVKEESKHE